LDAAAEAQGTVQESAHVSTAVRHSAFDHSMLDVEPLNLEILLVLFGVPDLCTSIFPSRR
jgi:hypothetical protein